MLAAGARGAEGVDAQVGRVEVDVLDLVGFRHHRDGTGRGVDTPLGLGFRHALHTVAAGLELQPRIGAVAGQAADDFAVAAEFGFAGRQNLDLPALPFGVARIHAEKVTGKQRRLVAARAGADFEQHAALVVRVLRQQQFLQLDFQFRQARLGNGHFLFGELAHVGIGQHGLGFGQVVFSLAEGVELDGDRFDLGAFAR